MIGLDDFREKMKAEIEKTKRMKSVQVSGKNLEDALEQASLELGLPLRVCLLYTSPSPRDRTRYRMPSSA